MEHNDCQVTPISDIRLAYELSGSDLKEKLTELKIDLLIYRPANVDIYASASVITLNSNEPKTLKDYHKKHKGTPFCDEHDLYTKLSEKISFITISVTEWSEMISFGKVLVNKARSIYLQAANELLTKITAQQIIRNTPSPTVSFVIDSGIFFSSRSGPLSAIDIPLDINDIYIKSTDAEKLLKANLADELKSSKNTITKEYWMSEKLLDLNFASELFISRIDQDTNRDKILSTIENWLRARWDTTNKRLVEQAALAIIPDELYESAPKKLGNSMSVAYRSSALTIINETAKAAEDKFLKAGGKRDKATTIQNELITKHKFTTNLAIAAATIISLKKRKPASARQT